MNQRVLEAVVLLPYENALTPDGQPLLWAAVQPQRARKGMDPQQTLAFVSDDDEGEM